MSKQHALIGVYGGTFDPIHNGHLKTALQVKQQLGFEQMRMMLSAMPPHRERPVLEANERFDLLKRAVLSYKGLCADDSELKRDGVSYMVDTLMELRKKHPNDALVLVLGNEAFNNFYSWQRWRKIIELSHIVVMRRSGFSLELNETMLDFVQQHQTVSKEQLKNTQYGCVYFQDVEAIEISATQIRHAIKMKQPVAKLMPEQCWQTIQQQGYYF